jgi:hypothetical protein
MDPISLSAAAALQQDLLRHHGQPATALPAPAPELVQRFEALMARVPAAEHGSISESPAVRAAVGGAEAHLAHHAELIDRSNAMGNGGMSLAELQAIQVQMTVQVGLMSMNQAACMQALGSTKSTVSALLKNQ